MIGQLIQRFSAVKPPRAISLMERAPQCVIYGLHVPFSIYLMLRHRGITLPTIANPGLEGSGLTKESKTDLFGLMGPVGRAYLPPFITVETGVDAASAALSQMRSSDLRFPVILKPDIGRRGFGVKLVHDAEQLTTYLARFRSGIRMLVQRYAPGPEEAGVFFLRRPSEVRGRILSLTLKHFPEVIGDGRHTLRDLIRLDPRARNFANVYFKRNRSRLDAVLASGQRYKLVTIGNHVRGAAFEDGSHHITDAMNRVFDTIVGEVPGFFIGRFDVRYASLEAFKRGQDFEIVEYNGAGGEPTHIWDPQTSIAKTYAGLLTHWRYLFEVGAENRRAGAVPMSLRELARRYFEELRLLRDYPDEE